MAAGWSYFIGKDVAPRLSRSLWAPVNVLSAAHRSPNQTLTGECMYLFHTRSRASLQQVVDDIVALNPTMPHCPAHASSSGRNTIRAHGSDTNTPVDDDHPFRVVGSLDWSHKEIAALPDSLGDLVIDGDLYLEENHLQRLPDHIGNLSIGGDLWFASNQLETLPESFGRLQVGGELGLQHNRLQGLPGNFGSIRVGEHLHLQKNLLESLPESFRLLEVGGHIDLRGNKLEEWLAQPAPGGEASLWHVTMGGTLWWDGGHIEWDS